MEAQAPPLGVAPLPTKKRAQWTPQEIPKDAPKNYVGAVFCERYLLRRRIGAGGMSTIYEARDAVLGKRVVVKILRDDLPSDPVDRFRREAHVLAGLSHEHIAQIIDRQDPNEGPRFLVTEYIDGHDLGELLRRGPVPAAAVLAIGLQVCAALAYAHDAGVIHRDVKPSNLMLARHRSGDIFVKVIDFGIAKLAEDSELAAPEHAPAGARRATRGNIVLGTAPFWCGEEGPQADVYALALTLAVLLTGSIPPAGVKVDLSLGTIPRELSRVLEAALALDGEIATMDALDAALSDVRDALDARVLEGERRRYVGEVFGAPKTAASKVDEAAPPPVARFAERYILSEELGRGGMGRVRVAFDTELRRRVALKTIHPQHLQRASSRARFLREARALAAIEHPGVPQLFEEGTAPEPFFTMEIVLGVPLKAEKRIEPIRALSLAIDLGEILVAAHEVGVVHRDVKPDNIVISKGDRVRLLDFGLCLLLPRYHRREQLFPATPPEERYETGAMEIHGTPGYTAPEIQAREGTSPRSDVYSVCAVLYRMLTGRSLLDAATSTTRPIHRDELPMSLGGVVELLRRGTAREPSDRPRSMADLVAELMILRSALLRARYRRQIARAVAITAFACLALTTLVVFGWSVALPHPPASDVGVGSPSLSDESPTSPPPGDEPAAPGAPVADALVCADSDPPAASPTADDAPKDTAPDKAAGANATHAQPSNAGQPTLPITEAAVAAVVESGRAKDVFDDCLGAFHMLRLVIAGKRTSLTEVDGMPFAATVPLHTCLRDGLHQLTFPRAHKPVAFMVPLDLRAAKGTPG